MTFRNELDGLDYEGALERLGGDAVLLHEIAAIALVECPQILDQIRQGLSSSDLTVIHQASHKMKDTVSSVGAVDAYMWASQLEQNVRASDLFEASISFNQLEKALKTVRSAWIAMAGQSQLEVQR